MIRLRSVVTVAVTVLALTACETNNYYPTSPEIKADTAVNLASQATLVGYGYDRSELSLISAGMQWNTSYWACAPSGIVPLMDFTSNDDSIIRILGSDAPVKELNVPCPVGQIGWSQGLRFATMRVGGATITRTLQANPKQSLVTVMSIVPYNEKG